jgi:hypothetical protein
LKREFRVPGGLTGAITCGIFPLLLLSLAMVESEHESVLGMNGLAFGALIIVAGFVAYGTTGRLRKRVPQPGLTENAEAA